MMMEPQGAYFFLPAFLVVFFAAAFLAGFFFAAAMVVSYR
jgi:hypothetical protein